MGEEVRTASPSWVHRAWVPIVAGAIAFVVTLLAGAGFAADIAVRTAEMRSLIIAIYASESVMEDFQEESIEAVEDHRASSGADQAKLDGELRGLAAAALTELEAAGDEIAGLPILPWHRSILAAREAYLLHNVAWQEYTARITEDPAELLRDQPLVNSTFEDAEQPILDAIPQPDLLDLAADVWVIFAPPAPTPGEVVSTSMSTDVSTKVCA